jgi:hypothetical protein
MIVSFFYYDFLPALFAAVTTIIIQDYSYGKLKGEYERWLVKSRRL